MREESPLDLDVPRDVGALFTTTLRLFGRHSGLFLSLTLLVVAPFTILVNGVWERGLTTGTRVSHLSLATALVTIAVTFAMPVLVTALHAAAVRELGDGRVPSAGRALRIAGPRFLAAVAAVVGYSVMVFVGTLLLVVPGIWFLVRGFCAAQVVVIERVAPFEALDRSADLVSGRWWRTAGTLLVGWLVWTIAFTPVDLAIKTLHPGVLYISLLTVSSAIELSLSALFGTLLYFSLRARDREQSPLVAA